MWGSRLVNGACSKQITAVLAGQSTVKAVNRAVWEGEDVINKESKLEVFHEGFEASIQPGAYRLQRHHNTKQPAKGRDIVDCYAARERSVTRHHIDRKRTF